MLNYFWFSKLRAWPEHWTKYKNILNYVIKMCSRPSLICIVAIVTHNTLKVVPLLFRSAVKCTFCIAHLPEPFIL